MLLEQDIANFEIIDSGNHGALHDRPSLVIFDIARPETPVERHICGESLLFEVPDRIVVSIGEEVSNITR